MHYALFAKLISPEGNFVDVNVILQRYICRDCGGTYTSRGPFYEGTIYGAPWALFTDTTRAGKDD
ncbi:MAG: hypothetical protein JRN50_03420, partial [Nitrososphaerota archaeon]|nr:hypothetical protein [Nitrososphaerota archaeon]